MKFSSPSYLTCLGFFTLTETVLGHFTITSAVWGHFTFGDDYGFELLRTLFSKNRERMFKNSYEDI